MNATRSASRILGVAFLFQAVASLASGMMRKAFIGQGDINVTMTTIANNPWLMRVNILGEMLTALGIIFLGAVLYVTLRKHNEKMALTGMGFYILEAVMLAVGRMPAFMLIGISQEYVTAGHSVYLQSLGNLALESMNYSYGGLAMLAFCLGAIPLYYLLDQSRIVPRALSLWGLTTVFLCLVATLLVMFGDEPSILLYLPYMPFEFVIGGWILVKGIRAGAENKAVVGQPSLQGQASI